MQQLQSVQVQFLTVQHHPQIHPPEEAAIQVESSLLVQCGQGRKQ